MKNKKWLLLFIIALPSAFWLILETSTINSYKLNFFGPKTVNGPKDTSYYQVPSKFSSTFNASLFKQGHSEKDTLQLFPVDIDTTNFPVYAIMFIKEKYVNEGYRLSGLWEYINYKKDKLEHIPLFIVTTSENGKPTTLKNLEKLQETKNVHFIDLRPTNFDSLNFVYFNQKPYYVDYSFFAMVDSKRHIRGYYDSRYAAEVKRLIDEFKHLRLKEEKQKLIRENEIKDKS